jgi:hypothetical protein
MVSICCQDEVVTIYLWHVKQSGRDESCLLIPRDFVWECYAYSSIDIPSQHPRRFIVDVDETLRIVLHQEDTDGDFQISITDSGPKIVTLGTASSNGVKTFDVRVRFIFCNPSPPRSLLSRGTICYRTLFKNSP